MGRSGNQKLSKRHALSARRQVTRKKDVAEVASILEKEHDFIIKTSLADSDGNWHRKGHISSNGTISPPTDDTKVISRIIEEDVSRTLADIFEKRGYGVEVAETQNSYPDVTLHTPDSKSKVALDVKTSYRVSEDKINGFTLGAFTGYFRDPTSNKNTLYPYDEYAEHRVFGVIYSRYSPDLKPFYPIKDIDKIPAVIGDFQVINRLKHEIASDLTGSGNTKNIGAVKDIKDLTEGGGPFISLGEEMSMAPEKVFNLYWRNYQTKSMMNGKKAPYLSVDDFKKRYKKGLIS